MNGNMSWEYMLHLLQGHQYTPHQCLQFASYSAENVGQLGDVRQHLKLTERLYTPTAGELFDMK
jgi:hypothetical protein